MTSAAGAREFRLEKSPYGDGAVSETGAAADARRMLTSILSKGLLGDESHGMRLKDHSFDILDETSRDDIQEQVLSTIARCCPGTQILASVFDIASDKRRLDIGITLGDPQGGPDLSLGLVVTRVDSRTVVREFYL